MIIRRMISFSFIGSWLLVLLVTTLCIICIYLHHNYVIEMRGHSIKITSNPLQVSDRGGMEDGAARLGREEFLLVHNILIAHVERYNIRTQQLVHRLAS